MINNLCIFILPKPNTMKKIFTILAAIMLLSLPTNAQWKQYLTGQNSLIDKICVVNDNVIWITDQFGEEFSITTDGGNNWVTKSFPAVISSNSPGGLSAVSATTAFIVVSNGTTTKGIYKTDNSGDTWEKQATGFTQDSPFPDFVYFFNENDGLAVGDAYPNPNFEIYTTSNGGNQWDLVTVSNMPAGNSEWTFSSNKIFRAIGNSFYFLTDKGRIFKSNDKGLSWTVINTPSTDGGNLQFDFKDENNGLLSNYPYELYSTADGGQNWTLINTSDFYKNIKYIPSENAYFSTHHVYGLSYSTDNGQTWNIHSSLKNAGLQAVDFTPSGKIFIGGWNYVYSSMNYDGVNLALSQTEITGAANVEITFTASVDVQSSQDTANYRLYYSSYNPPQRINVLSATLDNSNKSLVHLVTETIIPGDTITIFVSNVDDLIGFPVINSASKSTNVYITDDLSNYLISFAGTGASTTVNTVLVENLTTGESLILNGDDTLHLTATVGIPPVEIENPSAMKIYPNPMNYYSTVEIFAPVEGDAIITIYELTGKPITQIHSYLENYKQEFRLSGLKNGLYLINVTGDAFQFSGKLLCSGMPDGVPQIEKVNNTNGSHEEKTAKKESDETQNTVYMKYTYGDRLKFTSISGNYSTVVTDIPLSDKTITFNFAACTDGNNNNYPVVKIGTQVWMAENLKTITYNDGSAIPLVTDSASWNNLNTPAYCWNSNNEAEYKNLYGALYNWYTVNTGNLCPVGWHVPTDAEWIVLSDFLGGELVAGVKLKETGTGHWECTETEPTNESGFTALPGGHQYDYGSFLSPGSSGFWWGSSESSATSAWSSRMSCYYDGISILDDRDKNFGFSVRCLMGEPVPILPSVTTNDVSLVEQTTATCGGVATNLDGTPITARGVCWSTLSNPTIEDNKTIDGTGSGSFISSINNLLPGTTYYVRAYATNSDGTAYGNEVNFITFSASTTFKVYNTEMRYFHPTAGGSYPGEPYGGIRTPVKTLAFSEKEKAETYFAVWATYLCWITINADNSIKFEVDTSFQYDVKLGDPNDASKISHSDPVTGIIYLYYYYAGAGGNRIFWEVFTPQPVASPITDSEGNVYNTVTIGTQNWMAENLKATKYNDGTAIPNITVDSTWAAATTGAYTDYNNITANSATYGRLYNWYAVDNNAPTMVASNGGKNLCPAGWHIPTLGEWTTLITYLGGEDMAGGKLKETGTTHWLDPNMGATNETGFAALPGGLHNIDGKSYLIGEFGFWWSSNVDTTYGAWGMDMNFDNSGAYSVSIEYLQAGFSVRCLKNSEATIVLPSVTTSTISSITPFTATTGGNVSYDGGAAVTARGVCYSTTANPTITDSITTDGTGTGTFASSITGLTAGTIYYVRAYATNSIGTSYGNELSFFTPSGETIPDVDGNVYNIITIGTQTWMAENLKTTKYNDNSDIPLVEDAVTWGALSSPGYCWNNNDSAANKDSYGALYNWYTVNTNKLCPTGWHVPSDEEWKTLEMYLGMTKESADLEGWRGTDQGTQLKNTSGWYSGGNGTNTSGFSSLPGGLRYGYGDFNGLGRLGEWWSSTEYGTGSPWYRLLDRSNGSVLRYYDDKQQGASVRCLQYEGPVLPTVSTTFATSITQTTAISGGNITNEGGAVVTARGVCWSTLPNPTITNNKTTDGEGTGKYTSSITGLTVSTTYYVRAYAINNDGINYGNEISIFTYPGAIVSDIDSNSYNTVTIGTQTWIAQNLKTTKYNDGTIIPLVTDRAAWSALSSPGYSWYNNDSPVNKDTYGALYNWYTVNTGKLCPDGWHVPSDAEWKTLEIYLGMTPADADATGLRGTNQGTQLKNTTGWNSGSNGTNTSGTNTSGFTALPGGYRYPKGVFDSYGGFGSIGVLGFWWSSTEDSTSNPWYRYLVAPGYAGRKSDWNKNFGYSVRCLNNVPVIILPILTTLAVSAGAQNTASSGGNITSDGGATITARGVCWSTAANPTIADSITIDGEGIGAYTSTLIGLLPDTTYYVRAYATNAAGTAYGGEFRFRTFNDNPVSDIDGNIYNTVKIGSQLWMAENLKTTKYKDGEIIPIVSDASAWASLSTPGYCWYNNDETANKATYGALYNWYAMNTSKLCPTDWHIPSDTEWKTLEIYLGMTPTDADLTGYRGTDQGTMLKNTNGWLNNGNGTNIKNFSALPGGFRDYMGKFVVMGYSGYWWSSTGNAWFRSMSYSNSRVFRSFYDKPDGFSVRCLKD
jgi:uncharacterized protein (TIGR02145 family)